MHPLRLAVALPMGALALTLAATPAAAWPEGRGHGHWHGHGHGPRAEAPAPATVSVTGRGESTAAPDMAVITLGVTVQAPTAAEAMSQNTERQQIVIMTLRDRGIEGRDVQTSGLSLSPLQDYSREGQPPVITGYQATNLVTIRVRDLPRLGEALDALVGAGANEIHGIGFQRENLAEAEGEARARAVENARMRAAIMARAAGMRLGRLVSIADAGGRQGPQPIMRAMAMDSAQAAPVPIEAGELSVATEVAMTWELRPARRGNGGRLHDGPGDRGMEHHRRMMPDGMEPGRMSGQRGEGANGVSGDAPAVDAAEGQPDVPMIATPPASGTSGQAPAQPSVAPSAPAAPESAAPGNPGAAASPAEGTAAPATTEDMAEPAASSVPASPSN